MNNQAAQTMPELPEPFQKAVIANRINTMAVRQGYEAGGYEKSPDLYTADQMHQYARDYAAALSQTAGVAREWTPLDIQTFARAYKAEVPGAVLTVHGIDAGLHALAAAPAASGGERPEPDARCNCGWGDIKDHLREECTPKDEATTTPTPAASVSERARELRERAEAHGGGVFVSIGDIRAIEQALTQQRGDGEAVDRDAWAEALELPEGYTIEEFLPGGWHYAWTRADGERMVSGTTWNHPALAAIAAWQYAPATTPSDAGGEAVAEPFAWFAWGDHNGPVPLELFGWDEKACKYAVLTYARSQGWKGTVTGFLGHNGWTLRPAYATTPQPSADAVRELVKRWRSNGHPYVSDCADELESLLSAASDHQQNAAQGGGEK